MICWGQRRDCGTASMLWRILVLFSANLWFSLLVPLAFMPGAVSGQAGSMTQMRHLVHLPETEGMNHKHRFRYGNNHIDVQTPGTYYHNITSANSTIYNASELSGVPICGNAQWMGSNGSVHGRWYRDEAGLWAWEPEGCRLRRLEAAQAAACLAGRRVVAAGDSVSRYMYLALVHWLAAGYLHHPYDDEQAGPSITNKNQWHGWRKFYAGAARTINRALGRRGSMRCEGCNHGDEGRLPYEAWKSWMAVIPGQPPPASGGGWDEGGTRALTAGLTQAWGSRGGYFPYDQLALDFFYVYRYPTFALAGMEAVSWAYNLAAPNITKQRYKLSKVDPAAAGADGTPDAQGRREQLETKHMGGQRQLLGQQDRNLHPYALGSSHGFLRAVQRRLAAEGAMRQAGAGVRPPAGWRPPDLLILNQGIFWMQTDNPIPQLAQLFKYTQEMALRYNTTVIWKTTTTKEWDKQREPGPDSPDTSSWNAQAVRLALQHGFKVLDVRGLVTDAERQGLEFKWSSDSVHFLPVVYEQMNDLLLNLLC